MQICALIPHIRMFDNYLISFNNDSVIKKIISQFYFNRLVTNTACRKTLILSLTHAVCRILTGIKPFGIKPDWIKKLLTTWKALNKFKRCMMIFVCLLKNGCPL